MTLTPLSTEQCIQTLQWYASAEVRSWNPFKLFRKRKLKNHTIAGDLANILKQPKLSDDDLLKIANNIDHFEDSELQHDLLCFLYSKISDRQNLFVTKKRNITQINNILQNLVEKHYSPWWTLFLIELPYYSNTFRNNITWLIGKINHLFTSRRAEIKQQLIHVYSNEEMVNQIISEYHTKSPPDIDQPNELSKILDISLDETIDKSQKELIKEIKNNIITNLPFGSLLVSAAGLSFIIQSYLSKNENKTKTKKEQAQELIYIIGKIFLKTNATQITKSILPGAGDLVEAFTSVAASQSSINPLHTDKKIGSAVASAAGGALGGAIGTMLPIIGTPLGAYIGAVLSKTAATRFYQVLETWQTAPKGPESIIPRYTRSFFAVFDNDAKNILEPIYINYLKTESISKKLGDEIAQWICIYTSLQNSGATVSEEQLEIIDEEMNRLKLEFNTLKNHHGKMIQSLYSKTPDNPARVQQYIATVKECLGPLHKPIVGMLNEYFSPTMVITPKSNHDSYTAIIGNLPTLCPSIKPLPSVTITKTRPNDLTKQSEANLALLDAGNFRLGL